MTGVAWYWAGLVGVGLICVASTGMLRRLWSAQPGVVQIDAMQLSRVWVVPWALCIGLGDQRIWLCRDEVAPGQWAGLLRFLELHAPRQALGLSISS